MIEQRHMAVVDLIDRINRLGGTCTFEHVQAGCHLLQAEHHVPLDYRFVLHGFRPYSEDLDEDIAALRRVGWLASAADRNGNGAPVTRLSSRRETSDLPVEWAPAFDATAVRVACLTTIEALLLSTMTFVLRGAPSATEREIVESVTKVTAGIDPATIESIVQRLAAAG